MIFRIVTPFRPFVAESKEQKDVDRDGGQPFDWLGAIAMMRESARRACPAEVVILTDVDTELPGPVFHYQTQSRRLMVWIVEVALRYIESADFDRDTILIMPDMLVFGDPSRWLSMDYDLGLIARVHAERPLLNSVQFWPWANRDALARLYRAVLAETANLSKREIVWGGDTVPFVRLFPPAEPDRRVVSPLGVVQYLDADKVLQPFTALFFRKPRPDHIIDFRYLRKLHMRDYFKRMFPPMIEAHGWFFADGDRFMAGQIDANGGYQRTHLDAALAVTTRRRLAVDGGAHVGTWTVPLAGKFDRVISFEPSPDTFAALMMNLGRRSLANVEAKHAALGAAKTTGAMSLSGDERALRDGNLGARFLAPGAEVKVLPLDALKLDDLDFLKLDVEGSEVDALAGARETLLRCKPVVLFEDKFLWKRYGHDRRAPHDFLAGLGAVPLRRVMKDEIWGLARMRVEVVTPSWLDNNQHSLRLARASQAGLHAAGYEVAVLGEPTARAERLVIWGLGHPRAQDLLREATARGVTVIGWDLAYWNRSTHYRVSIDHAHPRRHVMAERRPLDRFFADNIVLRDDGDPNGPVILVGIGWKSADTYGEQPGAWEDAALARIRAAWPERRVIFRPKPGGGAHRPSGLSVAEGQPIESLLRNAAAVYCRHSNVAVDAIIAGVPAVAEDGAAAAVLDNEPTPGRLPKVLSRADRVTFLANLAWFQWSEREIARPECWAVIDDIIKSAPATPAALLSTGQ